MGYNTKGAYTRQLYNTLFTRNAESVEVPQFKQRDFDELLTMRGKIENIDYTKEKVFDKQCSGVRRKLLSGYLYRRK